MPSSEPSLHTDALDLMQFAGVPGLSLALVQNDEVNQVLALGVRNVQSREPVNVETVFEAASLSKPVVAYAVLQLVDAGALSLDVPLARYCPSIAPDDAAAVLITARHVLSHTSGLPNLGSLKYPLRTYFSPGSRFSYSGQGFALLQAAVESLLRETLEQTLRRLVFEPLAMGSSSFVWQQRFESNFATPHEGKDPGTRMRPITAYAAYSLQTTATDYAMFLRATLTGLRLNPSTAQDWFEALVPLPLGDAISLENAPSVTESDVAWGLGWGVEPSRGTFFHWGSNTGARAFVMGNHRQRSAVVAFMNCSDGLRIVPKLLESCMPGEHPVLRWLASAVA